MRRRDWLGLSLGALSLPAWRSAPPELPPLPGIGPEELARDEAFWRRIRRLFRLSASIVNLNSGNCSSHPEAVAGALEARTREANEIPGLVLWRRQYPEREALRERLARLAGCAPAAIALQRNGTEALNAVIQGMRFQPGDEILASDQEYPAVRHALRQTAQRMQLRLTEVALPVPAPDAESLIRPFAEAIGPRTRLLVCSHIVFLTGQILPVRGLARLAHAHGAQILVDGAHSFAQLGFRIPELECDYFAASLHKWLCGPPGTGLLYVREDRIPELWPLFPAPDGEEALIRKFEHLGTRSIAAELALHQALDLHEHLGAEVKMARLRYLRQLGMGPLSAVPGISLLTGQDNAHACAMSALRIAGMPAGTLSSRLLQEHRMLVMQAGHPQADGIRISPQIYTRAEDMSRFAGAVRRIAAGQ
ncbi:MAG: aminotransferase class V-fold PLP-dependent enzyme [Bacteroidia bacterium]|nr:aminotransferase class V-fold PLP-dependent enzyme [Bacteroidia bacterium]